MSHLSEEMLNQYLDGELPPDQQSAAASHLAGCQTCRAALEELESVFDHLAAWTPLALPYDISQRVMGELEPAPKLSRIPALAWAGLAFQTLLSLVLGVLVYPWLAGLRLPRLGNLDFSSVWQTLGGLGNWLGGLPNLLSAAGDFLPGFSFGNINSAVWVGAVVALALGWLALNRLLLKAATSTSKESVK